jgi:hypothetical protein
MKRVQSHVAVSAVVVASVVMMVSGEQLASAKSNVSPSSELFSAQYKTMQTIDFENMGASFREVMHGISKIYEVEGKSGTEYSLEMDGIVRGATNAGPISLRMDDSIISISAAGIYETEVLNLKNIVSVMNNSASGASETARWEQETVIHFGAKLRDNITVHCEKIPIAFNAATDATLVTFSTEAKKLQGNSGHFACEYTGAFVYSQSNEQIYQSSSIFVARKGSEKLRIEELTYLVDDSGKSPKYDLVDLRDELNLSLRTGVFPMQDATSPPWLQEALAARESFFCTEKMLTTDCGQALLSPQVLVAKTAKAMVEFGTLINSGEAVASAVDTGYIVFGNWIGGHAQHPSGLQGVNQIETVEVANAETAVVGEYALYVPEEGSSGQATMSISKEGTKTVDPTTPKPPIKRAPKNNPVVSTSTSGMDLGSLLLYGGAGIAIAVGASGSGGGSSGGDSGGDDGGDDGGVADPCDNGLADTYDVIASAGCTTVEVLPPSDVDISMTLNTDCTYTGSATVFGVATAVTPGTWSYTGTTLTITGPDGSVTTSVAESASSFTTSMRPFFTDALNSMISSLSDEDISAIEDECGSVDAYLDTFSLQWTR